MKLLKRLKENKKGFTLLEAVMATTLVAVAASMSVGVFVSTQNVNQSQYEINNGQNTALANGENTLSMGSVASAGDGVAFEMTPAEGSSGFSNLEDGGKIEARCQSVANDKAEYKVFKLDAGGDSDDAVHDYDDDDDEPEDD